MRILTMEADLKLIEIGDGTALILNTFDGGRYEVWNLTPRNHDAKTMLICGNFYQFYAASIDIKEAYEHVKVLEDLRRPLPQENRAAILGAVLISCLVVSLILEAFFK